MGRVRGGRIDRGEDSSSGRIGSTMHSVVGNKLRTGIDLGSRSFPEQRTVEEMVPSDGVIFPNDLAVHVRKPEQQRQYGDDEGGHGDGQCDSASW